MPDPISSSGTEPNYESYDDLTCRSPETAAPAAAEAGPTAAYPADDGDSACIESLVRVHSGPSASAEFVRNRAVAPDEPIQFLYGDSGFDSDGTAYAGAALLHGRDPVTGFSADVAAVSVSAGGQAEIDLTGLSIGVTGSCAVAGCATGDQGHDEVVIEGLTAGAAVGSHNPDGSVGFNASAGASLVSAHATVNVRGSSVTLGTSVSVSAGFSIGTRDSDGDGATEYCVAASIPGAPASGGACIEAPRGWQR
jgi:hypothetical protein